MLIVMMRCDLACDLVNIASKLCSEHRSAPHLETAMLMNF